MSMFDKRRNSNLKAFSYAQKSAQLDQTIESEGEDSDEEENSIDFEMNNSPEKKRASWRRFPGVIFLDNAAAIISKNQRKFLINQSNDQERLSIAASVFNMKRTVEAFSKRERLIPFSKIIRQELQTITQCFKPRHWASLQKVIADFIRKPSHYVKTPQVFSLYILYGIIECATNSLLFRELSLMALRR